MYKYKSFHKYSVYKLHLRDHYFYISFSINYLTNAGFFIHLELSFLYAILLELYTSVKLADLI